VISFLTAADFLPAELFPVTRIREASITIFLFWGKKLHNFCEAWVHMPLFEINPRSLSVVNMPVSIFAKIRNYAKGHIFTKFRENRPKPIPFSRKFLRKSPNSFCFLRVKNSNIWQKTIFSSYRAHLVVSDTCFAKTFVKIYILPKVFAETIIKQLFSRQSPKISKYLYKWFLFFYILLSFCQRFPEKSKFLISRKF
jgi:hypothetical protein